MKKFEPPKSEFIKFLNSDAITTSYGNETGSVWEEESSEENTY